MRRYLRRLKIVIAAAVSILVMLGAVAWARAPERALFTHQNARVGADETLDMIAAAGCDIVVAGAVKNGLILLNGNLTLESTARIEGPVLAFNGQVIRRPGAQAPSIWIWRSVLFERKNLFLLLLAGGAAGAALIIYLMTAGSRWLRRLAARPSFRAWAARSEKRWPLIYILASFLCSAWLLLLFAQIVWDTLFAGDMFFFDRAVIWFIQYFHNGVLSRAVIFFTELGTARTYLVLGAAVGAYWAYRRYWQKLAVWALCVGGGGLLNLLMKQFFERPRPELFRVVEEKGYSFPSGHAMVSLCFYGMLFFLLGLEIRSPQRRIVLFVGTALLILLIGLSRIYLGVHYPSDVIAGFVAGSMWLFFCVALYFWRGRC